jgi:hypothetical protein
VITLTPAEEILRQRLIDLASGRLESQSYGDMADTIDAEGLLGFASGHPRYTHLIHALYHVNVFEHEHGRPMVGALAVSKSTGHSGAGFADVGRRQGFEIARTAEAEFAFWQDQRDKSYAYWAEHDEGSKILLTDAQFTAIMNELATIKRLLRQALHS